MVRRGRRRTKEDIRIAEERILWLFKVAREFFDKGWVDHSKRCLELARKIGMRYNVRIPKHLKRLFCKQCNSLLLPGRTATVRVKKGRIIVRCQQCGNILRYPYIREKLERKMKHEENIRN